MSRHYYPKTFLRQVPNALLKEFFDGRNQLRDILWYLQTRETEIDLIYNGWQALPAPQRVDVEKTFRSIDEMACESGVKALVDEGQFHRVDLAAELASREGFHHKAMWAYLHHREVFELASLFHYVESLPGGSWVRAMELPRTAPNVTPATTQALESRLSQYYREQQGRGHRCTVETYVRGGRDHYFFAYPDDYADTYIGHGEDGRFIRRAQKRAFEVVFVYDSQDGTLDLYAQGVRRLKEDLRQIFCTVILGVTDSGRCYVPTYDLDPLLSRDFRFPTDPADGIAEVRVREMRLTLVGTGCRRITLEADPKSHAQEIYDMMDECLREKYRSSAGAHVTRATFEIRFAPRGNTRPKKLVFSVSFPDSSDLKSKGEDERLLGEKYLKRWGIARA
jgi:hypothetical protein